MLEQLHHTDVVHKQQYPVPAELPAPNQEGPVYSPELLEIDVQRQKLRRPKIRAKTAFQMQMLRTRDTCRCVQVLR
jgi:hypothetical protein